LYPSLLADVVCHISCSDDDAEDTARKRVNHAKELAMLRTKGLPEPPLPAVDPAAHVHSMQVFDHHAESITVMMTSPFEFARLKLLLGGFTVEVLFMLSEIFCHALLSYFCWFSGHYAHGPIDSISSRSVASAL
jgi:hypothetical protein